MKLWLTAGLAPGMPVVSPKEAKVATPKESAADDSDADEAGFWPRWNLVAVFGISSFL